MSLRIKPPTEPPPTTRLSVQIPEPTAALLSAYQKAYEQSYRKPADGGFRKNEILLSFFNTDRDFQEFLKKHPEALVSEPEPPGTFKKAGLQVQEKPPAGAGVAS